MNKNHKLIICIFLIILFILTGCNSREDVKHISKENAIKYVNKIIDEPVEYVNQLGEEEDDTISYVFKLIERNIDFSVSSSIRVPSIDGSQFGNYKESLYINYESAIIFNNNYVSQREKLAQKYNIQETLDGTDKYHYYTTTINNYTDLSNLTNFYLELDKLYNFKEKDPKKILHIDSGLICSDILGSIDGINFSFKKSDELKYEPVYKIIEKNYVSHLKWFNLTDPTIPDNIWDKYDAAP